MARRGRIICRKLSESKSNRIVGESFFWDLITVCDLCSIDENVHLVFRREVGDESVQNRIPNIIEHLSYRRKNDAAGLISLSVNVSDLLLLLTLRHLNDDVEGRGLH